MEGHTSKPYPNVVAPGRVLASQPILFAKSAARIMAHAFEEGASVVYRSHTRFFEMSVGPMPKWTRRFTTEQVIPSR